MYLHLCNHIRRIRLNYQCNTSCGMTCLEIPSTLPSTTRVPFPPVHHETATAAVLRRIQLTWHTYMCTLESRIHKGKKKKLHIFPSTPPLHLHDQFRHRHCRRACSGFGLFDLSLNCSSLLPIHLVFCTSADRRLRYQPIACVHASRVVPPVAAQRGGECLSLGSPETFRNSTWTKTKGRTR